MLSVILNALLMPKSMFTNFGPGMALRLRFELHHSPRLTLGLQTKPDPSPAGSPLIGRNCEASRYWNTPAESLLTIASFGSPDPTNCGRSVRTPSALASSAESNSATGEPVLNEKIPFNVQPPSQRFSFMKGRS